MTDFSINQNNVPQIGNIDTNASIKELIQKELIDKITLPTTQEQAQMEDAGNKKSDDIQKELDDLENEKAGIQDKINKKEAEIIKSKAKIETMIAKSTEAKKKAVKDYQKEVDKIVEDSKKAYKKANQEGGKGMTQEQLTSIINKAMPGSPDLSKSIAYQLIASKELENVCNLSDEVDQMQNELKGIDIDINAKNNEYEQALENEKQAQQAQDTQDAQQTDDKDTTTQQQAPKVNCLKDLETNIYQAMLQNIMNSVQNGDFSIFNPCGAEDAFNWGGATWEGSNGGAGDMSYQDAVDIINGSYYDDTRVYSNEQVNEAINVAASNVLNNHKQ